MCSTDFNTVYRSPGAIAQPQDCYQWRVWTNFQSSRLIQMAPHETIGDLRTLLQDWLNPEGKQPIDFYSLYNLSQQRGFSERTVMPENRRISECALPKICEDKFLYVAPTAKYVVY